MKQYGVAMEAVTLQCRLYVFKIDDVSQPTPIMSPPAWQRMLAEAEKRRVS
ncbi:MAG: hypothetical protein H8K07_16485 [Nitrospira sp.]|nr:hypothetical protein [Nitrospira sp.]